jgi:hypothetical protein
MFRMCRRKFLSNLDFPKRAIDRPEDSLLHWGVRLTILAAFVLVATPVFSAELFRYRGAAKDGGTLEYVFEAGEQISPNAITKEKVAEIAADFMTTFYHVQVGALETQEFRTTPVPFWLVCFSDTIKGPLRQMFFVVLLPDGMVGKSEIRTSFDEEAAIDLILRLGLPEVPKVGLCNQIQIARWRSRNRL